MSLTITKGVNAFVSEADVTAWQATMLTSTLTAWTAATDGDKSAALLQATARLQAFRWDGQFANLGWQVLAWPRTGVLDRQNDGTVEFTWDSITDLPAWLVTATCLEALAILDTAADGGARSRERLQRQGVKSISLSGAVSETFGDRPLHGGRLISQDAYQHIAPYLLRKPLLREGDLRVTPRFL